MKPRNQRSIIISASSDIGTAISRRWISKGWEVAGTYRTKSRKTEQLVNMGVKLVSCDLGDKKMLQQACFELEEACPQWDVLVLCPGTLEPVGLFADCDFDRWEDSVKVNFISQLRIVHKLLPIRNRANDLGACVLFFAGGGTNNATENYSAYTISKIALIKMCELLDAEISDTRFVIVGPGWVKTKMHEETLKAGKRAGHNFEKTMCKLAGDDCTPMEDVLDCCDWLVGSSRQIVGGRNFSVASDMWGKEELSQKLLDDFHMYKLRRYGNDAFVKKER